MEHMLHHIWVISHAAWNSIQQNKGRVIRKGPKPHADQEWDPRNATFGQELDPSYVGFSYTP